ncbi:hypothetical protein [Calothrix sp. NIES-2098]
MNYRYYGPSSAFSASSPNHKTVASIQNRIVIQPGDAIASCSLASKVFN